MKSLIFLSVLGLAKAYWLMGIEDFITTERIDPIVNPGAISGHAHSVLGGSNFGFQTNTAKLRQSECTSIPIPQDKSNYWFPHFYFQWKNGSFSSMNGGAVIYYLFSDTPGTTTAFPDDFRMLSGDPTLRTYDPNSFAQQAVTFLCLDFNGVTTRHNSIPAKACPSGIRAQINFPSCWNGNDLDSADHKSHVAFMSEGPDKGSCKDPKYPVTLPRVFIEVYWSTSEWEQYRSQAMDSNQPFVFSHGDPTGYGYHADFINGWDKGVLQKAVDNCHCNPYGDPKCCKDQGIFDLTQGKTCRITKSVDEQTTGTIPKLPGNNPVQPEGTRAVMHSDPVTPPILAPVYAYTGNSPPASGTVVSPAKTATGASTATASSPTTSSSSSGSDGKSSTSVSNSSATTSSHSSSGSDGKTSTSASSSSTATSSPSSSGSDSKPSNAATSASSGGYSSHAASSSIVESTGAASSSTDSSSISAPSTASHSSSHVTPTSRSVSSSVAHTSTASSSASSGAYNHGYGYGSGSGSSSGSNPPPPASGGSGINGSHPPGKPGKGLTSVPSKDEEQTGSCNLGSYHRQYLGHKHHHGRSFRRVRRSHH